MKSTKKKSIKKKSVKKKTAKKMKPTNMGFLGTGTWNDQRYLLLNSVAGGTLPSEFKKENRDHLRRVLKQQEYDDAKSQFAAGDRATIAALVLSLKTNEQDQQGRKLDVALDTIAGQFQLTGGSDWTLALYEDKSIRYGVHYYFEVQRTK